MTKPELLAPIQDFTSLTAAISAGADAVYFGIQGFNMRAGAKNFEAKDLAKIVKIAHARNVKVYLALNVIVYEEEIKKAAKILTSAKKVGVDAIICWDMGIIQLAKKMKLEIHLSTQASVSNSAAAKFYKSQGVTRVVLAPECSLDQIKKIKKNVKIEIETFIHGAMCVSVSGRCFLSQHLYGKSANRGECLQPCRRKYIITQTDGKEELELGEDYVLSPKDMNTLPFIEQLIEAGIDVFKIEGRNRSVEYVSTVVKVYRQIIDFYFENKGKKDFKDKLAEMKKQGLTELSKVYNRGFGNGFYLGKPIDEWSHSYGSQATERKIHIGRVTHFYPKISVAEVLIEAGKTVKQQDELQFEGETTGIYRQKISSMEIDHISVKKAGQGDKFAVKLNSKVKAGDKVYKVISK